MRITEGRLRQIIREEVKRSIIRESEDHPLKYVKFPGGQEGWRIDGKGGSSSNLQFSGEWHNISPSAAIGSIEGPDYDPQKIKSARLKGNPRVYAGDKPGTYELRDDRGEEVLGKFTIAHIKGGDVTQLPGKTPDVSDISRLGIKYGVVDMRKSST
jgi:hypothetical protein